MLKILTIQNRWKQDRFSPICQSFSQKRLRGSGMNSIWVAPKPCLLGHGPAAFVLAAARLRQFRHLWLGSLPNRCWAYRHIKNHELLNNLIKLIRGKAQMRKKIKDLTQVNLRYPERFFQQCPRLKSWNPSKPPPPQKKKHCKGFSCTNHSAVNVPGVHSWEMQLAEKNWINLL